MSRLFKPISEIISRTPSPTLSYMKIFSTQATIQKEFSELARPHSALLTVSECSSSFRTKGKALGERSTAPHKSFYRRELPPTLIPFTSQTGRQIFKESLEIGFVENYFSLVGNFTTQSEPSCIIYHCPPGQDIVNLFIILDCGLGSLSMVLNAMEVDPGRTWKGVWRWYSDEMLECCSPLEVVKKKGITFDQFVCLAQCHGLSAVPKRRDLTYTNSSMRCAVLMVRFIGVLRNLKKI